MPVSCPIRFQALTKDEFHRLDYIVMHHAFACHNTLGRFCDEKIYQTDLAFRLGSAGVGTIRTEARIQVSWKDFHKAYHLDLVVQNAAVYELKAVTALTGDHAAQLLNYILLLGLSDGKLVNFRQPSVQSRFISTRLTLEKRRAFHLVTDRFETQSPKCASLVELLTELLADWGAFLKLDLYEEALTWFLGGESAVQHPVVLTRDGSPLGQQPMHLLSSEAAFHLTALTDHQDRAEDHLRRFLALTPLRALQWINFNHAQIELITLHK